MQNFINFNEEWASQWLGRSQTLRLLNSVEFIRGLDTVREDLGSPLSEQLLVVATQVLLLYQATDGLNVLRNSCESGGIEFYRQLSSRLLDRSLVKSVEEGINKRAKEKETEEHLMRDVACFLMSYSLLHTLKRPAGKAAASADSDELKSLLEAHTLTKAIEKSTDTQGLEGQLVAVAAKARNSI